MLVMAETSVRLVNTFINVVANVGLVVFVIAIIGIVLIPAMLADSKGYSYWGFLILSIVAFPIALMIALVLTDRSTDVMVGSLVRSPHTVNFSDGGQIPKEHRSTVLAMEPTPDRVAVLITAPDGRNRWVDRAAVKPA